MIDPSDSKEIKQDYLSILESLLERVKESAKSQGYNPSNDVSIQVGSKTVYESLNEEEPKLNKLTPEIVATINKAISEPKNFKGSVRIKIGKQPVYHAKDGKVILDKLGFTLNQKQDLTEQKYTDKSVDHLTQEIEALQQKVQEQKDVIDALKPESQSSENLSRVLDEVVNLREAFVEQKNTLDKLTQGLNNIANRSAPEIKNTKLQNFVGVLEKKVEKAANNLYAKATTLIAPKIEKVQSQIESQINRLTSSVTDQIEKGIQTINSTVMEAKGKAITSAVGYILKHMGDQNSDGSMSLKTASFHFHQHEGKLSITSHDGRRVAENNSFTSEVTVSDVEVLDQVPELAQHLSDSLTQTETLSSRLKR